MHFNFIEDDDDEELDLSDLLEPATVEVDELAAVFESDIPERKTLKDPEVRSKARESRKAGFSTDEAKAERRANGVAFYCTHFPYNEYGFDNSRPHYSKLCEQDQDRGKVTCTCHCHRERGYVRPEPEYIPGSDDEEILLLID